MANERSTATTSLLTLKTIFETTLAINHNSVKGSKLGRPSSNNIPVTLSRRL